MTRLERSARAELPPLPSLPGLLLRLTLLEATLALAGLARTRAWIERRSAPCTSSYIEGEDAGGAHRADPAVEEWVARAERAVAMAAALFPGRAECLERSLLLYWVLRRRGVSCALRFGVQLYPFVAHAWVERRGAVLNDVPEHVAQFAPVEAVAP